MWWEIADSPTFGYIVGWSFTHYRRTSATPDENGVLNFDYDYNVMGHRKGSESLSIADADTLRGTWSYGGRSGESVWRRAKPRLLSLQVGAREGPTFRADEIPRIHVTRTYYWREDVTSRGNRPSINLTLYGRNLWGKQFADLGGEPGMEVMEPRPVYREGGDRRRSHHRVPC